MNLLMQIAQITVSSPLPRTSPRLVANILYLVFGILGGISLIIITWAGMKYTLSSGDPQKTAEAKNQIIYAAVGIAVALSAGSIVAFTVGQL